MTQMMELSLHHLKHTNNTNTEYNVNNPNNNIDNSHNEGEENIQYDNEYDDFSLILDQIIFDTDFAIISLNTNHSIKINHSLCFYGIISTDNEDIERLKLKLSGIQNVILMQNEEIKIQSDDIIWKLEDKDSVITFYLELRNVEIENTGEIPITKVRLEGYNTYVDKKINNYYIYAYQETDNKVTVAESPLAPLTPPIINEDISLTYQIMTINHYFNKDFTVNIKMPDKDEDFFVIENVEYYLDEAFTGEIKERFRNELTITQFNDLKIYTVTVTYKIIKYSNIIFQPNITIDIAGVNQTLAPFSPLFLSTK